MNFKQLRAIAHHLQPIVTIGAGSIAGGAGAELNRALEDHELVKVRFDIADRQERRRAIDALAAGADASVVQRIGKVATLYRRNPHAKPALSNAGRSG